MQLNFFSKGLEQISTKVGECWGSKGKEGGTQLFCNGCLDSTVPRVYYGPIWVRHSHMGDRQLSGSPQQIQQMFSHIYGLQGLLSRAIGTKKPVRSRGGEGEGEG